MTAACGSARELFAAYLDETLRREERSEVRAHLVGCEACRREASALDPAFLFAALPAPEVSAAETAQILAAVRSGIALKTAEKRIASAPARRGSLSAIALITSTAAAAVGALALAWTLAPRPADFGAPLAGRSGNGHLTALSHPAPSPARAASAVGAVGVATTLEPIEGAVDGPASPFAASTGPAKGNHPADATIYDWNPGGGQPRVVWIVDRSLDI